MTWDDLTPEGSPAIVYVVPCGGAKLDRPAPAAQLYTGSMFRHTFDNVARCVELDVAAGFNRPEVLILSAKHGLVTLDTVLEPYDQRMDRPGSVSVETLAGQAAALGIDWGTQVFAFLPRPYLARLDTALRTLDVYVQDVYEGTRGIGEQRRVNGSVGVPPLSGQETAAMPEEDGLRVLVSGDVHTLWWGMPVLVSYDRLRQVKTLPVASAPWVCDSGAFTQITDHGGWDVSPEEYAADLRRYATEIGRMVWAAPQDWPAREVMLDRTGLTEEEHQRRTIASVVRLRELAPDLPIIAVVTGRDLTGYVRHVGMYQRAGINLAGESLPVGVGGLVGRPASETAAIVRALHDAGVAGMHGFGVKGPALDMVGGLLVSVDSADWSGEARRRVGRCVHGETVWEANCPHAAREWAARQRGRADRARGVWWQTDLLGTLAGV